VLISDFMKRSEKIFFVQDLTARLKEAKEIVLIDYQGLNVSQLNKLREKIKQVGGDLKVVKNRLLQKALMAAGFATQKEIEGPTGLILTNQDEISPLKVILETSNLLGLPKFKFGFLGQKKLESEEWRRLANLPSRQQLLTQLRATLVCPYRSL